MRSAITAHSLAVVMSLSMVLGNATQAQQQPFDKDATEKAMERLKAKQAAGEQPADRIARLERENTQLKAELKKLKEDLAALQLANQQLRESIDKAATAVQPLRIPDAKGDAKQAWDLLMRRGMVALVKWEQHKSFVTKTDKSQLSQIIEGTLSDFQQFRRGVEAPADAEGRQLAAAMANQLDAIVSGLTEMRDGSKGMDAIGTRIGDSTVAPPETYRFVSKVASGREKIEEALSKLQAIVDSLCVHNGTTVQLQQARLLAEPRAYIQGILADGERDIKRIP